MRENLIVRIKEFVCFEKVQSSFLNRDDELIFALIIVRSSECWIDWYQNKREFNRSIRLIEWFFLFSRIDRSFRNKIRRFESLLLRNWMIFVFWSVTKWVEIDQCWFISSTRMIRVSVLLVLKWSDTIL